ncbi:MAG: hypothetical protein ACFHU9_01325 [Fluviicola sp.]
MTSSRKDFTNQVALMSKQLQLMAEQSCINDISDNFVYISSVINIHELDGGIEKIQNKVVSNESKEVLTLDVVSSQLFNLYQDLYDINFFIHRADKDRTVIDIRYVLKSHLDTEVRSKIIDNEPMFHAKIAVPPGFKKNEKFDVNWQHDAKKCYLT